jgi:hypothetical protein
MIDQEQFQQWLKNLKEGDDVALPMGWTGYYITKVTKTTASQIFIGGHKYRRMDGRSIGGYSREWLHEPTRDVYKAIQVRELRNTAKQMRDTLQIPDTKPKLEAFIAALQPFVKKG